MPAPEIRKVLLGLPWQIEKDSSTLYHFFNASVGRPWHALALKLESPAILSGPAAP